MAFPDTAAGGSVKRLQALPAENHVPRAIPAGGADDADHATGLVADLDAEVGGYVQVTLVIEGDPIRTWPHRAFRAVVGTFAIVDRIGVREPAIRLAPQRPR